jgi:anionic cell wall polymer biosynthesis LytR-Cps2A-Psr (LCP) family protein
LDDQIQLDSKLFISEWWDKNSDDDLSSYFQQKLTDVEKTELAGDLTIEEIKKTVISMKFVKYPGDGGINSDFYQFYWESNDNDFVDVVNEIFHNFEQSDSQYNSNTVRQDRGSRQYS